MKREGKASDYEILIARLIDRALRPLFPDDFHAAVFVTVNLISADKDTQPDALAGLAAASALAVSDIPFNGPISEVRVARIDGQYCINPGFKDLERADLELMVGATAKNIMMVEGEMKEVSEEVMLGAIMFAHQEIKKHCAVLEELTDAVGKRVKREYCHEVNDETIREACAKFCYDRCYQIAKSALPKQERTEAFDNLKEEFMQTIPEEERDQGIFRQTDRRIRCPLRPGLDHNDPCNVRRQPAEGDHRKRDRPRTEVPDRGPAYQRSGCRRHREHPRTVGRRERQGLRYPSGIPGTVGGHERIRPYPGDV